jgi:hypothetical protein
MGLAMDMITKHSKSIQRDSDHFLLANDSLRQDLIRRGIQRANGYKWGVKVFNLDVSLVNNSIKRKASSRKEKNGFKIIP